ncbi:hypothetical protein BEWA_009640 [Theileria equi strain WA]|uniref:Clu domain-containing protein n=1 Tax=Theileria equi strain WA TaxID=1537102 RepID=L0B152_THEEQ|nr:hypothetical protein BEWA_009640 [Theileria equi strain WA]AFZ81550.1 hypothetical protein BEWA_009640 [Theileria equi strain WA]|eukprot:XP_004831216.1 hypothetical protein BEWA_009640 [Theileria equi strain WA]
MLAGMNYSEFDSYAPLIGHTSSELTGSLPEVKDCSSLEDGQYDQIFDFLSNWTTGETLAFGEGTLDWLDPYSNSNPTDEDELSSNLDSLVISQSRLHFKLNAYLHGTDEFNIGSLSNSWDIPEIHPLRTSISSSVPLNNYAFNTNWYERIQFSFRSIWQRDIRGPLHKFYNEEEYSLLQEVGRFSHACKLGSTRLLQSLLSSNMLMLPSGFVEINSLNHPYIYQVYKPKFKHGKFISEFTINIDRIFLNDGIVFTLVLGNYHDYSHVTYTSVKKIYSNDTNGKQALCDALYHLGKNTKFILPIQCAVDYIGIRVVAEPLVQIRLSLYFLIKKSRRPSHNFVVYDILQNLDKHKTKISLFEDGELCSDLRAISEYLRLISWPLPFGSSDMEKILTEGSGEHFIKSDDAVIIRNTHEVLPPSVNLGSSLDPLFKSRFRLEFCTKYYEHPLKCSIKSHSIFGSNYTSDNDMFIRANDCNYILLENNIDKFHNLVDSWDISNAFHSSGINLRHIGVAYEKTLHGGLKDVLGVELVARAIKHLWNTQLELYFVSNSLDLDLLLGLDILNHVYYFRELLKMINDTFGLTSNSPSFWHQHILPEISMHYTVINLDGINSKSMPHILLKKAIEFNLGIVLPNPDNGFKYDREIGLHDLKNVKPSPVMLFGVDESCLKCIIPRLHIAYPRSDLSIYKAAYKLYNKQGLNFNRICNSDSFGMGICNHVQAKLVGNGYPCDPTCVLDDNLVCNIYKHNKTGLDLFCLSEALLLSDPIKRSKLLITLGYEFLRHRDYDKALECCDFLLENACDIAMINVQAKLLKIECCSLKGDYSTCLRLYKDLSSSLKHFEGDEGVFRLQLLLIMSFDAWRRRDYNRCISYINDAKDSFTNLFCIPNYEWLPVAFLSLLGYCYNAIGRISDSTKINREVVRHCNLSKLPKFTLCKLMWILVDSLIRIGSYEQSLELATELYSIIEREFGTLSSECLHSLYLCAWINQQIGCLHLLHPYLYLSNSENIIALKDDEWFDNVDLILDEFATASSCDIKRRHCEESISFYTLLCKRFISLSRENKNRVLEILKTLSPTLDLSPLQKLYNITSESIREYKTNEHDINLYANRFLKEHLENGDFCKQKLLLVIKNFISVKTLSLSTRQCYVIACKLYNAYASQISSEYVWDVFTGSDINNRTIPRYRNEFDPNHKYRYGSTSVKGYESFLSSVIIKKNAVPHSGHDLRSIEMMLLKEPCSSESTICELCLDHCQNNFGTDDSPSIWFDSVFELVNTQDVGSGSKFLLSLDILRHFLTPCQRLVILGLIASMTKSDLADTITFKTFKAEMLKAKCKE